MGPKINSTYNFSSSESPHAFSPAPTETSTLSPLTNHSLAPVSDEEADYALRSHVCRQYGATLQEYFNQFAGHDDDNHLHSDVNASLHKLENNDLDTDLNLNYFQNFTSPIHNYLHQDPASPVEDDDGLLDLNLDLLTNNEGSGNATVCFAHWDRVLCWPETPVRS